MKLKSKWRYREKKPSYIWVLVVIIAFIAVWYDFWRQLGG
jgi:hypothetical protein